MRYNSLFFVFALVIWYLVINLPHLTSLPVFADEAIYIRWAQLIIDDSMRYFFYPMNDGKTPLLMWLTAPILTLFSDQLLAARLVLVMAGLISSLFVYHIAALLQKDQKSALLTTVLFTISPFSFFYHRLAITDGLLFTCLIASYYFALKLVKGSNWSILGLAIGFFLAIMSKTPALLFAPVLYLSIFFGKKLSLREYAVLVYKISVGIGLSLLTFYGFRIVPLFGQLFAVGGNFLHDKSVIFSQEILSIMVGNTRFFVKQLWIYLGPVLILALPWSRAHRKQQLLLLSSSILFLLPLISLGKIIYPRYALPSTLFIFLSAGVSLQVLWMQKKWFLTGVAGLLITIHSFSFIHAAYFNPNQLPLSSADREQFLEEWSSGHGIKESTKLIQELAQTQRVAVATEGHFGTLPDGILLNLHNQNVENLYVEGVGQPIRSIPENFWQRSADFDRQLLVVNSHRLQVTLPENQLLASFCRPNNAPCLQVWEIHRENFK